LAPVQRMSCRGDEAWNEHLLDIELKALAVVPVAVRDLGLEPSPARRRSGSILLRYLVECARRGRARQPSRLFLKLSFSP
jgi:hypothetical protein